MCTGVSVLFQGKILLSAPPSALVGYEIFTLEREIGEQTSKPKWKLDRRSEAGATGLIFGERGGPTSSPLLSTLETHPGLGCLVRG